VRRMLAALWAALSSRALAPLVIGFFLLLYIGIAFFTEETLTVLIAFTGKNLLLAAVLSLLPLNFACRIAVEVRHYLKARRALSGSAGLDPELYDEVVELASPPVLAELETRLAAAGYRTKKGAATLAAWRGLSLSPARIVLLAGIFSLFAGIFVSLETRTVQRQAVIEGSPFPTPSGTAGVVERIIFKVAGGPILAKELVMEVAQQGEGVKKFGVYPPTIYQGAFAYPRYLGIALDYRFTAPDLPGGYQGSGVFPIYPPGKEKMLVIPDSPYKIALSLARPEDRTDPYMTGRMVFLFKVLKGKDVLTAGSAPKGGQFAKDGVGMAVLDARRMVITDFVVDYGVLLIWGAGFLLLLAAALWLPVRLCFPRREMLFSLAGDRPRAGSHAEGRARRHAGAFHEVLDFLADQAARREGPTD
jgi:hypothetical protein